MKLKEIWSGGQTGADQTFLGHAKLLGLKTGGWVPLGWKTDEGPAPWLGTEYGLQEDDSPAYPPRTWKNVRDTEATVWIGGGSPGRTCTKSACRYFKRPFYDNPSPAAFLEICNTYTRINGAGNRRKTNPAIIGLVDKLFSELPLLK